MLTVKTTGYLAAELTLVGPCDLARLSDKASWLLGEPPNDPRIRQPQFTLTPTRWDLVLEPE